MIASRLSPLERDVSPRIASLNLAVHILRRNRQWDPRSDPPHFSDSDVSTPPGTFRKSSYQGSLRAANDTTAVTAAGRIIEIPGATEPNGPTRTAAS
jgi:hypothetical protein